MEDEDEENVSTSSASDDDDTSSQSMSSDEDYNDYRSKNIYLMYSNEFKFSHIVLY